MRIQSANILTILSFVLVSLLGCDTLQYSKEPVNLKSLEGDWTGYLSAKSPTVVTRCDIEFSFDFKVQDGRAISTSSRPTLEFNVPLSENGELRFKFKKLVSFSGDYGAVHRVDMTLHGQLLSDTGEGIFNTGGGACSGKWTASKVGTNFNSKILNSDLPLDIAIQNKDTVWEYGKPKFQVYKGDHLYPLSKKTCRGGKGECWKVMNVKTGETGYVSAKKMKADHALSYDISN